MPRNPRKTDKVKRVQKFDRRATESNHRDKSCFQTRAQRRGIRLKQKGCVMARWMTTELGEQP